MKKISVLDSSIIDINFYDNFKYDNFILEILLIPDELHNNYISDLHFNQFSAFYDNFKKINSQNKNIKGNIKLIFSDNVVNFDVSIFGLIALFKENFQNILFEITIPQNPTADVFSRFRDILFGLRSWYKSLANIHLFTIKNEQLIDKTKINEPEGVFPLILITPEIFNNFFVKDNVCFDLADLFSDIDKELLLNELRTNLSLSYATSGSFAMKNYKAIRKTIKSFTNKIDWKNSHRIIFQHYLLFLAQFDLLPEQIVLLKNENGNFIKLNSFKKRGLKENEMNSLKNEIKDIIQKLKSEPPILTLIFSVLINRNLDKNIEIKIYIERIHELFEFSRNLFLGIRELARNIIEHTESKKGILIGRIYNGDTLRYIKGIEKDNDKSGMINEYYTFLSSINPESFETDKGDFFDLVLFDEGKEGVIKKSIENIESLAANSRNDKNIYSLDLQRLREGKINFSDFYNTVEIKLIHQTIKTSSHWGLIIFTNLIQRNKGLFLASTYSNNSLDSFDFFYKYSELLISNSKIDSFFKVGSLYDIILPLDNIDLTVSYIANTNPKEPNFSETYFKELLNYSYVYEEKDIKSNGKYQLVHICVEKYFQDETVNEYRLENIVASKIAKYLMNIKQKKITPVFDFNNCEAFLDQSKLLRFLAELQKSIDIYSIILVNLRHELIKDLFDTLVISLPFKEVYDKKFWNQNHFILIYSFDVNNLGLRIYFTDILGGYTYNDFFILNKKIAATHFTYLKVPDDISNIQLTQETINGLSNSSLYISENGVIQNFEMIIEHNGKSLFEHSVEFILTNEI